MSTLKLLLDEQQTITDTDYELISTPSVEIYFTGNGVDREALEILDQPGIWYEVHEGQEGEGIHARWIDLDMDFAGLDEIRRLASILTGLAPKTTNALASSEKQGAQRRLLEELEKRKVIQRQAADQFLRGSE